MKIGIGLPNQVADVRAAMVPAWARRAEQAGFTSLASSGRIAYPGVMDTVALAAAAGATSTIGLLSAILLGPAWPAALLAKELAGIDGVSDGRLSVGIGIGGAPRLDDFTVEGLPGHGLGARMDRDLAVYRQVWDGEPLDGGTRALVPAGTRRPPLLFGGFSPAAFERMARWGAGYVGPSLPPAMVAPSFTQARAAWSAAGHPGAPRLVALTYAALGSPDEGRRSVADYYQPFGPDVVQTVTAGVLTTTGDMRDTARAFRDLGIDELIVNPTVADPTEIERIGEALL